MNMKKEKVFPQKLNLTLQKLRIKSELKED